MSFETPKDFQKYAQDCVKLAQQQIRLLSFVSSCSRWQRD
jgi:hypothetical protein